VLLINVLLCRPIRDRGLCFKASVFAGLRSILICGLVVTAASMSLWSPDTLFVWPKHRMSCGVLRDVVFPMSAASTRTCTQIHRGYREFVQERPLSYEEEDFDRRGILSRPTKSGAERDKQLRKALQSPAAVTTLIKSARSASRLVQILHIAFNTVSINMIHISAALIQLGKVKYSLTPDLAQDPILVKTTQLANQLVSQNETSSREVANLLAPIAALQNEVPHLQELLPALLKTLPSQISSMTPQAMANVLWALGLLQLNSDEARRVRGMLVSQIIACLPELSMMDIAQSIWGLASCGHRRQDFEKKVLVIVRKQAAQMSSRSAVMDLPQIACAFAKLGIWDEAMMTEIAFRIAPAIKKVKPWGLAALAWSWAQLKPTSVVVETSSLVPTGDAEDSSKQRSRPAVLARFPNLLQAEVERRGLTSEDIQRSPLGPDDSWQPKSPKARVRWEEA